jgi:DNA-binding GntR family transcriptional regulator
MINAENDLATSQTIALALKEEILSGNFPPGSRIRQEDVAQRYEASRSPVRDAFRILEAEGLLNLVPHSGAWISDLSLIECEEMYQIRERIEPLMLRLSLPNLSPATMDRLGDLIEILEKNTSVEAFLKYDREFHLLTYSGANTKFLGEIVQRMWNTTQHYRRAYSNLLAKDAFKSAHYEHHLLFNAMRKQDSEEAERVLYGHIRRTRLELGAHSELFKDE